MFVVVIASDDGSDGNGSNSGRHRTCDSEIVPIVTGDTDSCRDKKYSQCN